MKAGQFLAELYYRLAIVPVQIPPLRERKKDIPLLAAHFVRQAAAGMKQAIPGLSPETVAALLAYDWPGNVWELKRVLERAVVRAGEEIIRPQHLEQPVAAPEMVHRSEEASLLLGLQPSRSRRPLPAN